MTTALQLQARVFCGLALALAGASMAGARLDPRQELLASGMLVLLLGMPHGAFDALIARQLFGVAGFKGWALFCVGYLGMSVAVVGLWVAAPTMFLSAFLVISVLHFGGDPAAGVSRLSRGLYGGAVIVLPALWHGDELQRLLGLVAGPASAAVVAPVLSQLAPIWLCATVLACALQFKASRAGAGEWAALAALSVAAPPLVSFCVYFCAMHSPRHILRMLAGLQAAAVRRALALALWPTLAVLLATAVLGWLAGDVPLQARVMQLIFVSLAALTLPHMVMLEFSRRAALLPDR